VLLHHKILLFLIQIDIKKKIKIKFRIYERLIYKELSNLYGKDIWLTATELYNKIDKPNKMRSHVSTAAKILMDKYKIAIRRERRNSVGRGAVPYEYKLVNLL